MRQPLFTLSQVKEAFWDTFHESGEQWFDYLSITSKELHELCTSGAWDIFVENLNQSDKDQKKKCTHG